MGVTMHYTFPAFITEINRRLLDERSPRERERDNQVDWLDEQKRALNNGEKIDSTSLDRLGRIVDECYWEDREVIDDFATEFGPVTREMVAVFHRRWLPVSRVADGFYQERGYDATYIPSLNLELQKLIFMEVGSYVLAEWQAERDVNQQRARLAFAMSLLVSKWQEQDGGANG